MRLYKYDLVRAVSIAFVVAVHCHNYIDTSIPVLALVDRAIVTLFLVGNALFFMMSGRFNIKKREGDHAVAKYYLGKVRNILIPVVLFFFIRTVFNDWGNLSFTTVIKDFIKNSTFAFYHTEYWFIYDLVGILLVAPMLSKMVLNMTRTEKTAFLAVGFGYNALAVTVSHFGYEFPWGYLFSNFFFICTIGSFIEEYFVDVRRRRVLYIAAILSFAATVYLTGHGGNRTLWETAPTYFIMAIGLYIALLYHGEKSKPSCIVNFVAQQSFNVYLIHVMIILGLIPVVPPVSGYASLLYAFVLFIVVFPLSVVAGKVADVILVAPLKKLFDAIVPVWKPRAGHFK